MTVHTFSRLFTGLALTICFVHDAQAQVDPFEGLEGNVFSNEDFVIMDSAASGLLRRDALPDGSATNWTNPHTASAGTVTVEDTSVRDGMVCRKVHYTAKPRGTPPVHSARLEWCKTAQGAWKIHP